MNEEFRFYGAVAKDGSHIRGVQKAEGLTMATTLLTSNWSANLNGLYDIKPVTVKVDTGVENGAADAGSADDSTSLERTARGFGVHTFKDIFGVECSLQESSLGTVAAIWLGCDEANPRHMVDGDVVPVKMPREYVADTRMHLTQKQVAALLPHLQRFVDTGVL